jgi:hypothetical protein
MKKQNLIISNIKATKNDEIFQVEVRCTVATGSSRMNALQAAALKLQAFGKTLVGWINVHIDDIANEDGSPREGVEDSMNLEIGDSFSVKWAEKHGQEVAIQTTEITEAEYNALDEDEQLSFSQKGYTDKESGDFVALTVNGLPFYKTTEVVLADDREDTLIAHDAVEVEEAVAKGAKAQAVKA